MTAAPSIARYPIANADEEHAIGFSRSRTLRVLILPPLFDEMNRTRRTLMEAMRRLDAQGIDSVLPDLPGINESLTSLIDVTFEDWRAAVVDAAGYFEINRIVAIRGGCLLDDVPGVPRWRLAPVRGAQLLRAMIRTRIAGDKEAGIVSTSEALSATARVEGVELAGSRLSPSLFAALETAEPASRGATYEVTMDALGASPLWLRAEPGYDAGMAGAIADSVAKWAAACDA